MFRAFYKFAMRGNVMELAIGIIIGAAFGKIVSSFVSNILMPVFGLLLGKVEFSNLFINLSGTNYPTIIAAQAAGAATLNYGLFINTIVDFLIVAFAIFIIITQVNKMSTKSPKASTTKECIYCFSSINSKATRCPNCTSLLEGKEIEHQI